MSRKPIIVVDDEKSTLISMRTAFRMQRYENIITCQNHREFWKAIRQYGAEVVFLDLMMPEIGGEQLLGEIRDEFPWVPVVIITGINEVATAVRCMRKGAFDYITKPVSRDDLYICLKRVLNFSELEQCNVALSESLLNIQLKHPEVFEEIKTTDPKMVAIFKYIEAVAPLSYSILITGETGTGKELIARSVHAISGRQGEFVPVNIAGLDETAFSDTLFGHIRGAFTGAENERKGLVEQAANGTLFLDEIGDLSITSQVKLLRLLQENEYLPLGTDNAKQSRCRVVAATSKSLVDLHSDDTFRKDLYYRLKTHHISLPPLRKRMDDLPVLVQFFIERAAEEFGKKVPTIHPEIYRLLGVYRFPGNVRELRGMIFNAVAKHGSKMLSLSSIKEEIGIVNENETKHRFVANDDKLFRECDSIPTFKQAEMYLLKEALRRTQGNKTLAANMLGISPSALSQRIGKLPPE